MLSLSTDIPDGTDITVTASNENVHNAELRNDTAVFQNNVAKFSDLRFVGKSGRGSFPECLLVFTHILLSDYELRSMISREGAQ